MRLKLCTDITQVNDKYYIYTSGKYHEREVKDYTDREILEDLIDNELIYVEDEFNNKD